MTLTVGSLFTGIGGIDLGLERAGMEIKWQCENDPYARQVLAKHWPNIPCYPDVKELPDDIEPVDLICGGYPCQPFSLAGRRAGTDDPRHLWPYFADTLRLLRPRYALLENVPGHLSLGFGDVLADLAALGFDAEWELIPASAVGAPHLRYRLIVVAYAQRNKLRDQPIPINRDGGPTVARDNGTPQHAADTDEPRLERRRLLPQRPDQLATRPGGLADTERTRRPRPIDTGRSGGSAPVFRQGHPVLGGRSQPQRRSWWDAEPDVGRVANGVRSRMDRLRTLGNAVVPQVAEWVGRRIVEADNA